ncbi:hypothetical protein D3C76_1809400 [compost metagenome]
MILDIKKPDIFADITYFARNFERIRAFNKRCEIDNWNFMKRSFFGIQAAIKIATHVTRPLFIN